jgi:hypothetical protein
MRLWKFIPIKFKHCVIKWLTKWARKGGTPSQPSAHMLAFPFIQAPAAAQEHLEIPGRVCSWLNIREKFRDSVAEEDFQKHSSAFTSLLGWILFCGFYSGSWSERTLRTETILNSCILEIWLSAFITLDYRLMKDACHILDTLTLFSISSVTPTKQKN